MGLFVDAPPSWDEIANTKEFQSLTPNEKANVQRRWVFDRMNYDYDRGNEIDQKVMVKEFKKNGFEPTVINTGFKDFTDYRSYIEGQQAEGLQGKAREEALSPQYSFGEGLLVSNEQRMGALGAGLVRPFEGMAGLADMTVGKALEAVTGSRMGIDKLADNLHGIVADMGRGVETDVIHGFSEGGFDGGVSALVNMVLMEAPNQIIQLGIGAAGIPQPYALAMLGASSMGSKYNDLKNDQSLSELQKYSIATLNGAIEGVTELMDSIPFIKRMTSSTKQAIFREALRSKPFRTIGKEFLKTFGGEAAEEATGELLQNISEAVIRGEKIDWKELGVQVANAGIGGGVMGGMMGVGGVAYNRHADNKRTSRKAFQEMKAVQAGFNPASKEFSRIAKSADLPEKYSTREGRRKAVDDYDFHGEPIVFGEATDEDRKAALKERIAWYENIRDQIEDGDEKAEWEEYYKEWQDKLSALENKQEEPLPKPVDEEGNELGAEEVTTEETPVEQPEPPKEETPAVVEKPTEEKPTEEQPSEEKPLTTAEQITKAFNGLAAGVKRGVLLKLAQYVNEGRYDDASDWASKYVPADKLSGFMDEISKAGLSTMSKDEQAAKVDELINKYSPQETPSPTAEVKELAKTPKDRLNSFLETVSTEGERNRSFVSNNLSEIIEGDTGTKPLYEYIEDDLKNGYVPYEYEGNYYFKKNDRDSFSVSEDMFNYAKWLIEHKDEWGGVPATEEKQPTSKKRKKRSAIDAYMEDGSFDDDADMPTVKGARVAESKAAKKAAKRNPMLRGSVENETRTQEQQTNETDAEDSFVEQTSKAVKTVADGFGFDVVVHKNDADLPAEVQEDLAAFGEGTYAEAWVGSDGVVHLVASRLESSEAAVRKTLHEIVGHNGLAALFKGRNTDAWNDMVEKLWEQHKSDILKRCEAYVGAEGFDVDTNEGRGNLVEEWLARLAETNRKPMWWKSIVSKVRALLRSLGLGVEYSDVDIQQLLADAATAARRAQDANMEDANIRFSLVTDKKIEQEFNEDGKYITTYRSAMLGDDGKLYPPMATKGGEGMEIGKVYRSDEHPELRGKDGKFPLKSDMRDSKASGTVPAAYNPYFHSQAGMLNDQFAVAYDKSKMVTVKCRVLKSDIESGYQAEGAKDPVGYAEWATSGPVTRQMRKRGGRTVILSRYIMPVDIVEQKEVAKWIKDFIGDEDVTIPWNVVNQSLRDELEKIGVKVGSEAEFREAERIKNEKKKQRKVTGKTGNRYSVAKPVQDETSPIPQGPLPPIANIMRQRTARSPISNLRALRLPAIVMLGRELGGSLSAVDRIKRMPSALGVFRKGTREIEVIRSLVKPHQLGNQWVVPQGQEDQQIEMIKDYWAERGIPRDEIEIVMKTDEAAKEVTIKAIWHDKSQTLFKKVLGHEIGHLIDYNQGETTSHGNVLGTVGGMGYKYLRKIIGETPDNQINFKKLKKELHKQAEELAGDKPEGADELKAWRETVKAEYANLLISECEQNGWFQAAVIREELIDNTEWWSGEIGSDPNYRRYRTSPTELFAEAMSVLLNAPDKFAKQLPETWRMLQNYQKERPEFHKAWQGLMRMMNNEEAYTDALMKLAEEGFTADEETEIQIEKEHHDAWRAIKRKMVDSFADVNDASKQLVREGKVTLDETPISNIVSATHQSIKDYYLILAERLSKPLFDAGLTESDIGKYLEFQRIVNDPSINQGHIINPNGMTVNDAKDALAKLKRTLGKEKWELLDKWHKDFWQLRQETIIRLAEESGMYDKALIEHMKKNEWYSYRAVVEQIYNADGTEKRGMSKIYGLKGTLSPIANPLGWTYDHDMRLMGGILWNQARLKTIQFMKEQFPDLVNKVKKFGVVSKNAPDGFTRLAVLENGQYVEYDVAETWAKGFQSQLDRDIAAILKKVQWITNLYRRAWTTLSPTFLLNNVVRDYLASYQNLSGINRQIGMVEWTKCWMQGMKEAFKFQFKGESELIEGMMKSNMFQSGGKGYDMSGRSGELAGSRRMELLRRYGMAKDEQIRCGAIARFTKYLSDHLGITWLGDKLGKAMSATEMGAKAGGLLALQRNGEFTDAEKQWHVVRHIGSPDFAQRGTATPIWNTLFIFSNAAIQGWNRTLEMAKANPKGFAARFMATTGTAVFIQWALESGALLEAVKALIPDDDEDKSKSVALLEWIKKQYGRITHHNRYNYMCLPIAETDDGHCLAFRMPFAENSKLPAMMLHAALDQAYTQIKKEGNLWTETWRAALNQAPNFNPVLGLSGDAAIMYGCGWNGYDKYRQRHAVKTKDWEAGGWRRFKGTTAYMIHEYTPFAIVNNMFDLRDNPYWWWNLIGALGPGAWFKFQQYGETEQSLAVTAEKRRKKLNGKASAFYR